MSIKALGGLQLPNQKEWAAGVGGLAAFGIIAAFQYFGVTLSDTVDTLLVVALPPIISKLVPPSLQDTVSHLNDEVVAAGVAVGNVTPQTIIVAQQTSAPIMGSGMGGVVNASDAPVQAGPLSPLKPGWGANAGPVPSALDTKIEAEKADPLAHYKPPTV